MTLRPHLIYALILCLWPGIVPAQVGAPALTDLNDATLQALSANDIAQAQRRARAAVEAGQSAHAPDPVKFAYALNNLGYALSLDGQNGAEALQWLDRAISYAETKGLEDIGPWVLSTANRAKMHSALGNWPAAKADAQRLVDRGRGTGWHGPALSVASTLHFDNAEVITATELLQELMVVQPALLTNSYGALFTTYATAQEQAESLGQTDEAVALLDARVAILHQYLPGQAAELSEALLWQKFFQLHQAGRFGQAADTLRDIGATGPLPDDRQTYVDDMATLTLQATQLSSYSARREVQLPYAQMALAFAELAAVPDDPRQGFALREVAAAQGKLGQHTEAAQTLRRALTSLRASPEGRKSLHLVLDDLAANAWQRGDHALAKQFYGQAQQAYDAALTLGALPLTPMDHAITLTNRAQLLNDLSRPQEALALVQQAWDRFQEDASQGPQKWNSRSQAMRIQFARAVAQNALGQAEEAGQSIDAALTVAREALPDTHPDLALALANAADLLLVQNRRDRALPLLQEAVAINHDALPIGAPTAADTMSNLANLHMVDGDKATAIDLMRRATEARKSPAYQNRLAEAAGEFETLAWLLLDKAGAPSPADLDEALSALQWTQTTRSAQALAMMEARLALTDPLQNVWLRRRQDLREAHARNFSQLLAAYADTNDAGARITALEARHTELKQDLAATEDQLQSFGLDTAGVTSVSALSVAEIQALLAPDEAVVTFLLPGLRPDQIDGLETSSNHAIAITAQGVAVARIPDFSRGSLNDRIRAFRCQIAISDPGCSGTGAQALRGAMLMEDAPDEIGFDLDGAHDLYHDLFGGIEGQLDGVTHLLIAPPADLLRLPFHALVTTPPDDTEQTQWLIRRHAVSVLPSLASLRTLRGGADTAAPGLGRLLGVGDPVIGDAGRIDCGTVRVADLRAAAGMETPLMQQDDNAGLPLARVAALRALPRLPDAECEIAAIDDVFAPGQSTIFLAEQATEDRIKQLDASGALADFNVMVFATHGLTAGETGANAPGLVLTPPDMATAQNDGLLTAAEIATLTLNARLVVLSACNTAAGEAPEAEGLSGLARAFFHAGARNLMVTHWSVYSAAAVEISTGLFQELKTRPDQTHASALRHAMLAVLDDPDADVFRKHPSYWAAFAIVGAN